ncbi:hypothetical protein JCM18237_20850 [Halorubrum luteum]
MLWLIRGTKINAGLQAAQSTRAICRCSGGGQALESSDIHPANPVDGSTVGSDIRDQYVKIRAGTILTYES